MPRTVSPRTLVLLAFIAFVSLGLPDTLLGVAWPYMSARFGVPIGNLGYVLVCGTMGYLCASFSGGTIVRRFGVGPLLIGSTILVTLALLGNAFAIAWPMILVCALLGGLGAGAIDAGINLYAAARFSPRVVNWLHASWGIGATSGPLVMTLAITAGLGGWRVGYGIIGVVLAALMLLFIRTRRAWDLGAAAAEHNEGSAGVFETLVQPVVLLQVMFYFLYGGTEASAGAWLFTLLTRSPHRLIAPATAGTLVGCYWGMLTVGRIVFGQLATRVQRVTVMRIGIFLAMAVVPFWLAVFPFPVVAAAVLLLGFGLAPLYPTLMSGTPDRVGPRFAHHAVGLQVSACAGGIAVWPTMIGQAERLFGLEVVPVALIMGAVALVVLHESIVRAARVPARGFEVLPAASTPTE